MTSRQCPGADYRLAGSKTIAGWIPTALLLLVAFVAPLAGQESESPAPDTTEQRDTLAERAEIQRYWSFTPEQLRYRIDYRTGLVFVEDWSGSEYNGVVAVESLSVYLEQMSRRELGKSWNLQVQREAMSEQAAFDRGGLIPEINLPRIPWVGQSKIDISGSDRITMGGSQTTTYGYQQGSEIPSWLPELKLEQALRINLNGTIGDKTKVFLDHDSERQFESKQKIRLTYTGTEDEILQSIEAGDTRLSIPGTGYTGDLPAHNGLFGVSARGKMGGVDLYAVAAREQSESQTQTFNARNQSHTDTIYDYEYLRHTIYWVADTLPTGIGNVRVYVDDGNPSNNANSIRCLATVHPDNPAETTLTYPGDRTIGYFEPKMPNTDFYVPDSGQYIEFLNQSMRDYTVAISYTYNRGRDSAGGGKWVHQINPDSSEELLVLKLIKPRTPDSLSRTWPLEARNIYDLGARDITLDSVRLLRAAAGETPTELDTSGHSFLRLVGLDPDEDSRITWPQLDRRKGYLICPRRYPFIAESLSVPDSFYTLTHPEYYVNRKYYFVLKYSTAKESYDLGAVDILENSEKVVVNNAQWTKGVDYTINYVTGELNFTKALPPDADIRITFEYQPAFSVSEKSLLGTRAEWKVLDNGKFGASVFYRSEDRPEDKPSLGAEPFRRMVAETDFGYDVSSDLITSLLDRLPLVRAEAPTTFHVGGEGALSLPDPNTRGAAYLDDFEGSTLSRDVSTRRQLWQPASVPAAVAIDNFALTPLAWTNPTTRIPKESIFGSDIGEEGRDMVDYMRIAFKPDNISSWAGLMNCPSRLGMNLSELENIEGVIRCRSLSGRIHITAATSIDEDAPRRTKSGAIAGLNGLEDTEDKNHNGSLDKELGEDTGIDGVPGADAQMITGDDGNDDYDQTRNPNGTENNSVLDGEDIMGAGWTRSNDYYEYTISLSDTAVVKSLVNGWKSVRLALSDSLRRVQEGSPRAGDIRVVRVWFDSFSGPDTIDVYSLAFVGSKWRNPLVIASYPGAAPVDSSELAAVALISKKTDPAYEPPFEPKKDQLGRTELEASLNVKYTGVRAGHRAIVRKATLDPEDYRDYRTLRVYLHNDPNDPDFFVQVGSDSANYYEVRRRISAATPIAGRANWYELLIDLDTLPQLKAQLGTLRDSVTRIAGYSIAGNPSLDAVRYMALGLENTGQSPISGTVWIDDIRVSSPRRDIGAGFNAGVSLRLSDLGGVSLNYRYEDPNFRRFSEGQGVKTGGYTNGLGLSANLTLDRFFPQSWGLSIPLNYSRNTSVTTPKYASNYPDLRVGPDRRKQEAGGSLSESWSLSARKNTSPVKFLNYTLEALSYNYSGSRGSAFSLLDSSRNVSNSHSLSYGVNPDLKFKLGGTTVSWFPNSVRLSGRLAQSKGPSWHRNSDTSAWVILPRDSSASAGYDFGLDYTPVSDLSFSYNLGSDRDLTDENYVGGLNVGQESGRDANFSADYDIELGEILSPRVGFDAAYSEDRAMFGGRYSDKRNAQNAGDIDLNTDFALPEVLQWLGQRRDAGRDSGAAVGTPQWFLKQLENSDRVFSPIELSYSYARTSNYTDLSRRPPLAYQFGFTDVFVIDSLNPPSMATREVNTDFSSSTELRISSLSARFRYNRTWGRDISGANPTGSITTNWPDISLSLSRVEGLLPKLLSTSSFSSGWQVNSNLTGTYAPGSDSFEVVNRRLSTSSSLSPLLSWQATWKNKLNTTFSTSYTRSDNKTYIEADRATSSFNESRSYSFNLGYSFSAPTGLRLPFLRKVKFSSDLGVSAGLTAASALSATTDIYGQITPSGNTRDWGTNLGLTYRFSSSIDAGLNAGYNTHQNVQGATGSQSTSLDFWVLFKF
jgi:hypothetical protein